MAYGSGLAIVSSAMDSATASAIVFIVMTPIIVAALCVAAFVVYDAISD